jgi:3'-5' exoribonuclease-like protein
MDRLFLDCEFTGLVQNTSLISFALYRDDDCYFYAEFNDFNAKLMNSWIETNVIGKLNFREENECFSKENKKIKIKNGTKTIVENLKNWLNSFDQIEIWGDVPIYDWVLFCELFGGSLNLPGNVFYIPFDIATLGKINLGKNDFSRIEFVKDLLSLYEQQFQHNALIDAKAEKLCYEKLITHA